MGRSNRPRGAKRRDEEPELDVSLLRTGFRTSESRRGIEYIVQPTNGKSDDETKTWLCPHCNVTIRQGTNHLVVWDSDLGVQTRRHFHKNCWSSFTGTLQ